MTSPGVGMVATCAAMSAVAAVRDLGYLLKWIAHDWDDEVAVRILTNCRTAMAPARKVLVVEVVIPPRHGWVRRHPVGHHDAGLHRQLERTEGEYRNLPSSRPDTRQTAL